MHVEQRVSSSEMDGWQADMHQVARQQPYAKPKQLESNSDLELWWSRFKDYATWAGATPHTIKGIMMPLLGFYSSIVAVIGGGFLCAVSLDIPPITFIQRLREVVPITDLWVGLLKAPVFGVIIALAGCFQGMQVKANAEEVGLRTTSAVVQAIFLVIVLDAFFAVFFTWLGWN